jgi:hypothetical protein
MAGREAQRPHHSQNGTESAQEGSCVRHKNFQSRTINYSEIKAKKKGGEEREKRGDLSRGIADFPQVRLRCIVLPYLRTDVVVAELRRMRPHRERECEEGRAHFRREVAEWQVRNDIVIVHAAPGK